MKQKTLKLSILSLLICGYSGSVYADEYDLDGVIIEAAREHQDKFGNEITEQSYYRTGGDVDVIDRAEIDKGNYAQLSDALKRLPGVNILGSGYRGGEYGYSQTHTIVAINGDERVVVLINGRRVDNSTSTYTGRTSSGASKANVDINQITSMDNIEKIEVIKGPSASVYGADATGGVINIITRKGSSAKGSGTLDVSTGSWDRHNYRLNYAGSGDDGKFNYFIAMERQMGGESKYKDGLTKQNYTFNGTAYKDENVNLRLDYDFDDKHSVSMSYSHMNAMDDYPLTAPYRKYLNEVDWNRLKDDYFNNNKYGDVANPGYRNLWCTWLGAYNAYNKNSYDLDYKFNKDNGMDSFIRLYNQNARYWGSFGGGDAKDAPVPYSDKWDDWAATHYKSKDYKSWMHYEKNHGIQLQLGKQIGNQDLLSTWTYDNSIYRKWNRKQNTQSNVERKTLEGYFQDKIHVSDKFEITPALRYSHYSGFANTTDNGVHSEVGDGSSTITPAINSQYAFDDKSSMYFGWTKVSRPLRMSDYDAKQPDNSLADLQDEKGDVITLGIRKKFDKNNSAAINYDYTKMSNAVARYSVWDKPSQDFIMKYVNAKENKKSININAEHKFNDNLAVSGSYTHLLDEWMAKPGCEFDPDLGFDNNFRNVNGMINKLRPTNIYKVNLAYENRDLYVNLLTNWYTGCDTDAYTDSRFLVLDLGINYTINKDIDVYSNITNLTNTAWESNFYRYQGIGAFPQPGRCYMIGVKYKF